MPPLVINSTFNLIKRKAKVIAGSQIYNRGAKEYIYDNTKIFKGFLTKEKSVSIVEDKVTKSATAFRFIRIKIDDYLKMNQIIQIGDLVKHIQTDDMYIVTNTGLLIGPGGAPWYRKIKIENYKTTQTPQSV
jgi:hypothetical protein